MPRMIVESGASSKRFLTEPESGRFPVFCLKIGRGGLKISGLRSIFRAKLSLRVHSPNTHTRKEIQFSGGIKLPRSRFAAWIAVGVLAANPLGAATFYDSGLLNFSTATAQSMWGEGEATRFEGTERLGVDIGGSQT